MKAWEWECLTGYLSTCALIECGPLHGPIKGFKLTRDEDLKLILETTSALSSKSKAKRVLSGTVQRAVEQVQFAGQLGDTAVARGVVPYSLNYSSAGSQSNSSKTERSKVHTVEWSASSVHETMHTIQWLENMPTQFIWPHFCGRESSEQSTVTYRGDGVNIEINDSMDHFGGHWSCAHISLDGLELFVVKASNLNIENIRSPGFILYKGSPTDEVQFKVSTILSFCLGQFLIDLGYTCFDSEWQPTFFKARSAHTMHGTALQLNTLPPTLLHSRSYNEINKDTLAHMMKKLWNIYDVYDLRNVFWAYWHAAAAPAHFAAVHYCAAIESLQRRYAEQHGTKFKTTLLEEGPWKTLSEEIKKLIVDLDSDDETRALMHRKVQSLNFAPQSTVMNRFFSALGIRGGDVELSAWNKRNRAAHGSKIPEHKFIEVIRDNKALMILLNRILLAISGASEQYCDYYTEGHRVSALALPIPADR